MPKQREGFVQKRKNLLFEIGKAGPHHPGGEKKMNPSGEKGPGKGKKKVKSVGGTGGGGLRGCEKLVKGLKQGLPSPKKPVKREDKTGDDQVSGLSKMKTIT